MRLFVPLTRDELERLKTLAVAERRRPQDQAAILLARAMLLPMPSQSTVNDQLQEARRDELERAA